MGILCDCPTQRHTAHFSGGGIGKGNCANLKENFTFQVLYCIYRRGFSEAEVPMFVAETIEAMMLEPKTR